MTRDEIERVLRQEVDRTRAVYEHATEELSAIVAKTPSELLIDGNARMAIAQSIQGAALEAHANAVVELSKLVHEGLVPDWLKDRGKAAHAKT